MDNLFPDVVGYTEQKKIISKRFIFPFLQWLSPAITARQREALRKRADLGLRLEGTPGENWKIAHEFRSFMPDMDNVFLLCVN